MVHTIPDAPTPRWEALGLPRFWAFSCPPRGKTDGPTFGPRALTSDVGEGDESLLIPPLLGGTDTIEAEARARLLWCCPAGGSPMGLGIPLVSTLVGKIAKRRPALPLLGFPDVLSTDVEPDNP